jgi:hypothetical protein
MWVPRSAEKLGTTLSHFLENTYQQTVNVHLKPTTKAETESFPANQKLPSA